MKTPQTITLLYGDEPRKQLNPLSGEYEAIGTVVDKTVPCLLNFITKQQQFTEYGTRDNTIAIVRFNQEQEPFVRAKYNDDTYIPVEAIDTPIKGAVRIQKVVE